MWGGLSACPGPAIGLPPLPASFESLGRAGGPSTSAVGRQGRVGTGQDGSGAPGRSGRPQVIPGQPVGGGVLHSEMSLRRIEGGFG